MTISPLLRRRRKRSRKRKIAEELRRVITYPGLSHGSASWRNVPATHHVTRAVSFRHRLDRRWKAASSRFWGGQRFYCQEFCCYSEDLTDLRENFSFGVSLEFLLLHRELTREADTFCPKCCYETDISFTSLQNVNKDLCSNECIRPTLVPNLQKSSFMP